MFRRLSYLLLLASLLLGTIPSAGAPAAQARSPPATHAPARALLSPSSLTQTSTADFGSCDSPGATAVVTTGGGAVQLAGVLADDFTDPELDAHRWLSGVWHSGSYT